MKQVMRHQHQVASTSFQAQHGVARARRGQTSRLRASASASRRTGVEGVVSRQLQREQRLGSRSGAVLCKATEEAKSEDVSFDENINPFCSLDDTGKPVKKKKTLGEMEQEYLDALRQFYMSDSPSLSDEEFDVLKDELLWEGSTVVTMTKEEQMFLEATKAYSMGKPVLSDEEFNELKLKLKTQGSTLAIGGPRCSIRSRRVYSDMGVDYFRLTLLNIPGVGISLSLLFILDFLTGFSISKFVELPEPLGFIAVWVVVLPILYVLSDSLTKVVLKDALILNGQCTNCGENQVLFFGKVLGIDGNDAVADVQCEACKCKMTADSVTRELVQKELPKPKKAKKKKAVKA